jgi:hypothetical protein
MAITGDFGIPFKYRIATDDLVLDQMHPLSAVCAPYQRGLDQDDYRNRVTSR